MRNFGFGYSALLGGVAAVVFASSAYSFTLTDDPSVAGTNTIYYGATNTYNNADIIGSSPPFSIFSAVVSRSGANNDILNIIINTNFAGAPALGTSDGTNYGSLFLNPLNWSVTGSAVNHYSTDNFVNGNQNWEYAVTTPGSGNGGSGLYATGLAPIGPSGVGPVTNSNGVPQFYTMADGSKIVMSNVSNNPLSAPAAGNPGFYFRQGQAVEFDPSNTNTALRSATVTTVNGSYIEYSILDNGLLGNTFALAWDMTCGNDVIQGLVNLQSTDLTGTTPLPAALPLFAGGLGILGVLGRRRKRNNATASAAA